ncbi:MAG: hypothetical protein IJG86_01815 [Clostridia bacterium]|nr:hypothetical protein [Clostridia bacterium]
MAKAKVKAKTTGTGRKKATAQPKLQQQQEQRQQEEENEIRFDDHLAPLIGMHDVDAELDFDLSDFQIFDTDGGGFLDESKAQKRILQPRIDVRDISHKVLFESAEKFAQQIDLRENARTFAWVSGNFIFGDIIEALVMKRDMFPKNIFICSLSISQENIDSLKNIILMCPELERLTIVLSGYFYSHEKYGLVPYMYQELDDDSNKVQIAFGGYHAKVIAIETIYGNTLTIHGSANLRSSNSIEQVMVERGRDLYEFNAAIIEEIATKFGTINYNAPSNKIKRIEGNEAWRVIENIRADDTNTRF